VAPLKRVSPSFGAGGVFPARVGMIRRHWRMILEPHSRILGGETLAPEWLSEVASSLAGDK